MKISYNSPVILTYAIIAIAALAFCSKTLMIQLCTSPSRLALDDPGFYLRLFTYIAGHAGWQHLYGNLIMILLVGPLLEEKYGSGKILEMILVTAVATAILNVVLFSTAIMGGSGIAFMLILLSSFVNFRAREIPLTFLIIAALFMGGEIMAGLRPDHISQFSHMAGGAVGAGYGFLRSRKA
ncbi:MAG: rhomboid family intramembrane serine protease [Pseudomonadota bacterium]